MFEKQTADSGLIPRETDIDRIEKLFRVFPAIALLGPRQSGKSTLASVISARATESLSFDLENPEDLAALDAPKSVLSGRSGLVVIDEIQRRPDLFPVLRTIIDASPETRWLILGSASPPLLRQASESLAGRIGFHELLGFRLTDVGEDSQRKLWVRGGFPRAFLAPDDEMSALWREGFIRTFLERDIPQLASALPAPALRRLWTMLAHSHGGSVNNAALSRGLELSQPTVARWIDLLEQTFMLRSLRPWTSNVGKRLVKRPKLYIRDSGILHALLALRSEDEIISHPILGASWEGFALEETVRALRLNPEVCFFWGTHAGAEVDLLWERGGKRFAAEFKFSDAPRMTRSIVSARSDLGLDHLWIVYPGEKEYPLDQDVSVIPLNRINGVDR